VLGSGEELRRLRNVVGSFCRNIDGNPFLRPVGRFLIRKPSVGATEKSSWMISSTSRVNAPYSATNVSSSGYWTRIVQPGRTGRSRRLSTRSSFRSSSRSIVTQTLC
jgi:hypothetical protein